ncbi:MAG: hypothetical protein IJX05_01510 [Clostridia bacterium]|nr:hypothetical protein [Clostridia bacterium]
MILEFKQSDNFYIKQSEAFGRRGDFYKSLLYARRAVYLGNSGGEERLADALLESGNLSQACKEYLKLYRAGRKSTKVYAGLIKSLTAMSRYASATRFISEATDEYYLPEFGEDSYSGVDNVKKYVKHLYETYPYPKADESFGMLYAIGRGDALRDRTYMADMCPQNEMPEPAFLYNTISVVTPDRMDKKHAEAFLKMATATYAEEERPTAILATAVVALLALGTKAEAEDVADELASLVLPEDPVELAKCAIAMLSLRDYESAIDYLEELLTICFEFRLVTVTAIAHMNAGNVKRAQELFGAVLNIEPENYVARYWIGRLNKGETPYHKLGETLPREEIVRLKTLIGEALLGVDVDEKQSKRAVRYFLGKTDEYATTLARRLAETGLYPDVLEDELCSPEHGLEFVRDAVSELLCKEHNSRPSFFLQGLFSMRLRFQPQMGNENVTRAFVFAQVTMNLLGFNKQKELDLLYGKALGIISSKDLIGETNVQSVAAAVLSAVSLDENLNAKTASALFAFADEERSDEFYNLLTGKSEGGKL